MALVASSVTSIGPEICRRRWVEERRQERRRHVRRARVQLRATVQRGRIDVNTHDSGTLPVAATSASGRTPHLRAARTIRLRHELSPPNQIPVAGP